MKPKVLFVDNERWYVARHIDRLEEEYEVVFLHNVSEAVEALQSCDIYSCLVVDVMMPVSSECAARTNDGLDTGIWLIKQVEDKLAESSVPVILLTNRLHSDVLKCLEPFGLPEGQVIVKAKDETNPKRLLELVREQINRWIR